MKHKQRYKNKAEQLFYMNCCDCLRYGYGLASVPSCGEEELEEMKIEKEDEGGLTTPLDRDIL